ncbi:hypothetical protein CTEN210_10559 [Chaetoceros tenuissimus]|uniref:Carrier domain-containing protein n=1 Tax=Chaetoceros tenuissimus TaxID=426638 RepID=A0AAD3CXP7_9STRA|nr:hypothetical protein CTEN210_10559 [Chaetoceros tenuissimus]
MLRTEVELQNEAFTVSQIMDTESSQVTGNDFLLSLEATSKKKPSDTFATWFDKKGNPLSHYTFQDLWDEAGFNAYHLRVDMKLKKGDRVLICYNTGLDFFASFLGCLRAGLVAVPVYPPNPSSLKKGLESIAKVIEDSDAQTVLTDSKIDLLRKNPLGKYKRLWPSNVSWKVLPKKRKLGEDHLSHLKSIIDKDAGALDDIAFLQYTSGSTGYPKGVMVTFRALKANVNAMKEWTSQCMESNGVSSSFEDFSIFSWLPQYHDMGLIGVVITSFAAGWRCYMVSPIAFIQNPLLWLEMMSKVRPKWTIAPNFSYRLTARKFLEAKRRLGREPIPNLDLSSLVGLHNAAEPIQIDTKEIFEQAFSSYGLNLNWFVSGYGLAESVVNVTNLNQYKLSTPRGSRGTQLVAVGHKDSFPKGLTLAIVDVETKEPVGDNEVGEIWLNGPSNTAGYFQKPKLTEEVFHATLCHDSKFYLRTGDLGFFENNYLYICGRLKDMIIVNGVNYYPQDIEHAVEEASSAIRAGCVAAFASNELENDGNLEVVFEIRQSAVNDAHNIVVKVRQKIVENFGIIPSRVVAIKEKTICKTTSGKIQRRATRSSLHEAKFTIISEHSVDMALPSLSDHSKGKDTVGTNSSDTFDEILDLYLGDRKGLDSEWDNLGLSSMMSLQLRDSINDHFQVSLDADCFEKYSTPETLKKFVLGHNGTPLKIELKELSTLDTICLPNIVVALLQAICSIIIVLLFSFSIVPAWYFGKGMIKIGGTISTTVLAPFIVPVWMLSFSITTIALEWIVIWKYKEGYITTKSAKYVSWWMVDRCVSLWEFWVGQFILKTPLIALFYTLMGCKIGSNVTIEAFLREFDLVDVRKNSTLSYPIKCRAFNEWNENFASINFRQIVIGENCTVKGKIHCGCIVCPGSVIEKLSVVPEGSYIPPASFVTGNPAFIGSGVANQSIPNSYSCIVLGTLKLLWLLLELYYFFGAISLGQYLWIEKISGTWRYTPIFFWVAILLWFGCTSIVSSIVIKWVFIGKRKVGRREKKSTLREFFDWAADWHFRHSLSFFVSFTVHSRIWNIVLMMHGMDVDLYSKFNPQHFLPSIVDLVKMRKSFTHTVSLDLVTDESYHGLNLSSASIGYGVHLDATASDVLEVRNSVIFPLTLCTSSQNEVGISDGIMAKHKRSSLEFMREELLSLVSHVCYIVVFAASLIPSYEFWKGFVSQHTSIWDISVVLAGSFICHTFVFTSIFAMIQKMLLPRPLERMKYQNVALFSILQTIAYNFQVYTMIVTVQGSPLYNVFLRLLGCKVKEAIVFGEIYEFSLITIANKSIIDNAMITGHYVVFSDAMVGPSTVEGLVSEGCFVANASFSSNSRLTASLKSYVGTYQQLENDDHNVIKMDSIQADQVNDIENQQAIANQSVHDASDESRKVEENVDSIRVWLKGDGALSKVEEPFSLDSL